MPAARCDRQGGNLSRSSSLVARLREDGLSRGDTILADSGGGTSARGYSRGAGWRAASESCG
eukprot:CAMPEP_0197936228 /NCGR_PEP_ID=MMETSP1439-20131203/114589_1 /TAXON_ID=66791 /ORGANISM="Gonyaulax spinifera, Strain CCMP409" /LENGTH=61 /DNA_ID=CAMNT_0043559191 /DNA_START=61 /DNA_END=243 /DNA_ORIENTATION=-